MVGFAARTQPQRLEDQAHPMKQSQEFPAPADARPATRLPRVRFTLRRIMEAVAVAALICLVISNPYRHDGITDRRILVPVAAGVAAVYGIGAMRRPWMFLWPLIVVWVVTPQVDHPRLDMINLSAAGCFLGWIIGAPAGWISRCLTRTGDSAPSTRPCERKQ
jgi:hypothetical protein